MNFNKYFAFLALLVLCLLGQQTTEAHFLGKVGHKLVSCLRKQWIYICYKIITFQDKAAKHVDTVAGHIDTAKKVVEAGSVIAGVVAS